MFARVGLKPFKDYAGPRHRARPHMEETPSVLRLLLHSVNGFDVPSELLKRAGTKMHKLNRRRHLRAAVRLGRRGSAAAGGAADVFVCELSCADAEAWDAFRQGATYVLQRLYDVQRAYFALRPRTLAPPPILFSFGDMSPDVRRWLRCLHAELVYCAHRVAVAAAASDVGCLLGAERYGELDFAMRDAADSSMQRVSSI